VPTIVKVDYSNILLREESSRPSRLIVAAAGSGQTTRLTLKTNTDSNPNPNPTDPNPKPNPTNSLQQPHAIVFGHRWKVCCLHHMLPG